MPQTARDRMYLTKDKKALVPQGDKRAATLYAVPGDVIPDSAAERFGLKDGRLKGAAAKEANVEGDKKQSGKKQASTPANKQAGAPANKEAGADENK